MLKAEQTAISWVCHRTQSAGWCCSSEDTHEWKCSRRSGGISWIYHWTSRWYQRQGVQYYVRAVVVENLSHRKIIPTRSSTAED